MPRTKSLTLESELIDLISDHMCVDKDIDEVTLSSDLVNDAQMDSLDLVELVMKLEERYDVTISDDEMCELKTVSDVVELVRGKK